MTKFIEVFDINTGLEIAVNIDHISKIVSLDEGSAYRILYDNDYSKSIVVKSNFKNLIEELNEG